MTGEEALKSAKPCPVCGSEKLDMAQAIMRHHVVCRQCYAAGPINFDKKKAVEWWNALAFQGEFYR